MAKYTNANIELKLTGDSGTWTLPVTNCDLVTSWTYPYTYTSTLPVYYYQLICPKCGSANWCELNKTVTCKCKAVLKATDYKVDYEVVVRK